ncbi:hypothetical protein CCACVL1_12121, partial [Corchorus capsularis]
MTFKCSYCKKDLDLTAQEFTVHFNQCK